METETPGRPFESLEWYRAAVRSGREERGAARVLSWLRGLGFLTVHISVFAVGIVVLIVINLLRSPEDLWVDRAGAAWALLLTIHVGAIGLAWAIGLLGKEDSDALRVIPDAEWRRAPTSWPVAVNKVPSPAAQTTAAATHPPEPGEQAPSPATNPTPPPMTGRPAEPVQPGWSGWGEGVEQLPSPGESKASWKEAATWLTRSGRGQRLGASHSSQPVDSRPGDDASPGGSPTQ